MNTRLCGLGLALLALAGTGAMLALAQPAGQPAGQVQGKGDHEAEGDDEEVITLDKAPEAVRSAALKLAGDAKNITKVIKEEDDDDAITYEVEYSEGSTACAAVFSPAGDVLETERATTEAKLPAAVLAALKKEYPKAAFADIQAVTRMYFEVGVVIDGKKHEVKVDATGDIDDESDEDHDDDHAKGEGQEGKKGDDDKDE